MPISPWPGLLAEPLHDFLEISRYLEKFPENRQRPRADPVWRGNGWAEGQECTLFLSLYELVSAGVSNTSFFKNKLEITHFDEKILTSGGLKCTFHRGNLLLSQTDFCLNDIGLFSVPHMGFYTYYSKSTVWIKKIMKSQFNIVLWKNEITTQVTPPTPS